MAEIDLVNRDPNNLNDHLKVFAFLLLSFQWQFFLFCINYWIYSFILINSFRIFFLKKVLRS